MKNLLSNNPLILIEAAVVEQLRRMKKAPLHPSLANAPLIYSESGTLALQKIYQSFIDISTKANLPLMLCTPTWRANFDRVHMEKVNPAINKDAVYFIKNNSQAQTPYNKPIKIGGMIGCKNDCYKPEEALSLKDSELFHSWQIQQLVEAGVDFLIAVTLPNLEEAKGIALAMGKMNTPYILSFVISREGLLLDGTPLNQAFQHIDSIVANKPLGYMINCAYPTFLCPNQQDPKVFQRLIGYQANASSLDHHELDNSPVLLKNEIETWSKEMLHLNQEYKIQILGGCCGTNKSYLESIT